MNLYKIEQEVHDGYDTYSDAVVVAVDEADARTIHPASAIIEGRSSTRWEAAFVEYEGAEPGGWIEREPSYSPSKKDDGAWADNPAQVTVTFVGVAADGLVSGTVLCASFHAG